MTLTTTLTNDAWSAAAGHTHVFSSNAVNEVRLGFSNNKSFLQSPAERPLFDEFGIKGVPQFDSLTGLPLFNVTNYSALGNRIQTPNPKEAEVFQINDNFSYFRGRHTMNFGGEYWRLSTFAGTANLARGSFDFNGQFTSRTPGQGTGNAVADLLLGLTSSASLTTQLVGTFLVDYYGGYFNDSWRISPKLTINLGLRYELQTRQREEENRQSFFDYTPGSPTYGTLVPARDGGHREETFSNLDKQQFRSAHRLCVAAQSKDGGARGLRNLLRRPGSLYNQFFGRGQPALFRPYSDQLADDCGEYRAETVGWISR